MHKSINRLLLSVSLMALLPGLFALSIAAEGAEGVAPTAGPQADVVALTYDATGDRLLKVYPKRLYQSSDGGKSWRAIPLPALQKGQLATAATPAAEGNALYIAGPGLGVQVSHDAGKTWQALNDSLPSRDVTAFAVHSNQPKTLYAVISGQGIYRSENAGQSWRKVDSGPGPAIEELLHSDMEGSMQTGWLIAIADRALRLSMDCFCGWRPAGGLPEAVIHDVTYSLAQPEHIYVATARGLYRSENGGQNFERISTADDQPKVALASTASGALFAVTPDGTVLRSDDQGLTWEKTSG